MAKFTAYRVTALPTSNIDEKGLYFLRSGSKVAIYVRHNNDWEIVGGTGDVEKVNGLTGEVEIDLNFTSGQLKVTSIGTGTPITTTSINLDTRYERLSNKVQDLTNPNATTYPSTQAIADLDLDDFNNESADPYVRESEVPASGVQSVTGDGVSGTPEDVVMTFPTAAEIGAIEDAPSDGKQYVRKDANWDEVSTGTSNLADVLLEGNSADGLKITNLANGVDAGDAVNLEQLNEKADEFDNRGVLEGIDGTDISNWDSAYQDSHTHANKSILDGIDSDDIDNWDEAYAKSHTHDNKTLLDSLDQDDLNEWNEAYTKSHEHSNKTTLDGITDSDIANWNSKIDEVFADSKYALRETKVSAGSGLTGGGNLTANRTIALSTTTQNDIGKGVTAHGWGNHADENYATETYVGGAIDDIEIGGRNYLLNTNFPISASGWSKYISSGADAVVTDTSEGVNIVNNTNSTSAGVYAQPLTKIGDVVTLSVYAKGIGRLRIGQSGSQTTYFEVNSNEFDRYTITFEQKTNSPITLYVVPDNAPEDVTIRYAKLEKGNKATDWTPAPEDQVTDWNETNPESYSFLKNKPTDLATQNWVNSQGFINDLSNYYTKNESNDRFARSSRTISAGNGLTGGGNLISNRTISLSTDTQNDITKGVTAHGWGDFREFGLGRKSTNLADITSEEVQYGRIFRSTEAGHQGGIISLPYDGAGSGRTSLLRLQNGRGYISSSYVIEGAEPSWSELWHSGNLTSGTTAEIASGNSNNRIWSGAALKSKFDNYYTKTQSESNFVTLSGVQTIFETKTFESSPVVPNPTLDAHAVNKGWVIDNYRNDYATLEGTVVVDGNNDVSLNFSIKEVNLNVTISGGEIILPAGDYYLTGFWGPSFGFLNKHLNLYMKVGNTLIVNSNFYENSQFIIDNDSISSPIFTIDGINTSIKIKANDLLDNTGAYNARISIIKVNP